MEIRFIASRYMQKYIWQIVLRQKDFISQPFCFIPRHYTLDAGPPRQGCGNKEKGAAYGTGKAVYDWFL